MGCWEGGCSLQGDHYNGAGMLAAGGRWGGGTPPSRVSPPPAWVGLVPAARMDGGTGMAMVGRGGRRCPMSPRRVTAPALGPAVRPQGWNGVSPFSWCDTDSTAGPILPEHLPTGQGHLPATVQERDPVPTAPHCLALGPLSALRGVPASPPRHTQTLRTPQRAPTCCKHHPEPQCHQSGLTPPAPTPGMLPVVLAPGWGVGFGFGGAEA